MEPAGLEQDPSALELTEHHLATVPSHGRGGEARQVRERDGQAQPRFGAVRQGTQSRPQDNGQIRNEGGLFLQDPERIGGCHVNTWAEIRGWA